MSQVTERDVDPGLIVYDPSMNARFGLKPARIKSLAEDIKMAGGLLQRVGLYPKGDKFAIKYGNYRVAAIDYLNKEGAMMKVPATIYPAPEGEESRKEVLLTNLMENLSRQDLTPMDMAAAMKALVDAGEDRDKIRDLFRRPGRKGLASNSWINITMGFLDLPKKVQTMIHEGLIEWGGAAELVKIKREKPEKLNETLAELEADRKRTIEKEEREEERFLNTIKRAEESKSKMEMAVKEAAEKEAAYKKAQAEAQANLNKAKSESAAKLAELDSALQAANAAVATAAVTSDAVAAATQALKAFQAGKVEAEKEVTKAQKALDSLVARQKKEAEAAKQKALAKTEEHTTAVAAAEKATKDKKPGGVAKKKASQKPLSKAEVAKAAKAAGATTVLVPLTRKQIMEYVDILCLPGGSGKAEKAVQTIGEAMKSAFNGGITDKQLYGIILKSVACK